MHRLGLGYEKKVRHGAPELKRLGHQPLAQLGGCRARHSIPKVDASLCNGQQLAHNSTARLLLLNVPADHVKQAERFFAHLLKRREVPLCAVSLHLGDSAHRAGGFVALLLVPAVQISSKAPPKGGLERR